MKRLSFACRAFLWLCLSLPNYTFAQVNATLGGTISDANGGVIPKVTVTAKNVNTGIVTVRTSNEAGTFEFPGLQPGVYTLTAALSGFQTATYNNVQLGQGQPVRLNFTLQERQPRLSRLSPRLTRCWRPHRHPWAACSLRKRCSVFLSRPATYWIWSR
jgi:hypothetical protein